LAADTEIDLARFVTEDSIYGRAQGRQLLIAFQVDHHGFGCRSCGGFVERIPDLFVAFESFTLTGRQLAYAPLGWLQFRERDFSNAEVLVASQRSRLQSASF
jgi:hypothetical protein